MRTIKPGSPPRITSLVSPPRPWRHAEATDVAPCLTTPPPAGQYGLCPILRPDLSSAMLPLINAHRASMGLGSVAIDARLQACIEWKMLSCGGYLYFSHDDAGSITRSWSQRMAVYYPNTAACGENLAWDFQDAASVMAAFLSDAGHRANIENTSWVGCGLAVSITAPNSMAPGQLFWGQDFGSAEISPSPPPPPPPPPPPVPSGQVLTEWLNDVLPLIEATSQYQKWAGTATKAGKAEVARWQAYVANPHGTPPSMTTSYGKALVADLNLSAAQG